MICCAWGTREGGEREEQKTKNNDRVRRGICIWPRRSNTYGSELDGRRGKGVVGWKPKQCFEYPLCIQCFVRTWREQEIEISILDGVKYKSCGTLLPSRCMTQVDASSSSGPLTDIQHCARAGSLRSAVISRLICMRADGETADDMGLVFRQRRIQRQSSPQCFFRVDEFSRGGLRQSPQHQQQRMSSFLGEIYAAIVLVVAGLERKRVTRSFTTDSLSLVVIVDHFSNLLFQ